ncbi:MAG: protein CpxP [Sulfurimonas sp.]|jgi:protein CpxP|uniref:Spy/CpxP family protein refolding chaperone n=1 Tax=Sulfurimonas sp. TaxID=2022749 RepID=UPI0039E257BC
MNTKLIISLGTTALVASSLLAFSPCSNMKQGNGSSCKQQKMMQSQNQGRGYGLMQMFKKLDLSDAQKTEIRAIVKISMQNIPNPHTAFSDDSFDKEQFVKLAKQRRANRVENKAEIIEKAYKVLTSSQKKDLKTMLDMKDMMKKSQMMKGSCSK